MIAVAPITRRLSCTYLTLIAYGWEERIWNKSSTCRKGGFQFITRAAKLCRKNLKPRLEVNLIRNNMQYLKVKGNLKPKVQLTGMCLRAFILQIEISPLPKTVWELMHCFVVLFTQELVALDGLKSHVNDAGSSNFRWDVMNDRIPRLRSFSSVANSLFYPLFSIQAHCRFLLPGNT